LFVANLPFSVTDEELAKLFSEKVPVTSAHVVKKRNGKSKGFGFVEYGSEEHQLAALKEFPEGRTLQERPINVKVAMVPELNNPAAAAAAASEGNAAAAAAAEKKEGAATASDADAKKGESAAPASAPAAAEKKDEPEKKDEKAQ